MTDPILTKTFWDRTLAKIDKGATPFEKFSQNQLYELVLAKNNNQLPRFGIAKFAIKVLTPAFGVKLTSAIKSYDRKEGRKALKNVTPLEFSMLYHNLTFDLKTLLTGTAYAKFVENVTDLPTDHIVQNTTPIDVQRLRRKFKRENGIL